MADESLQFPPNLTPDALAQKLGGAYPAIPPGYASFKGYLAPEVSGVHRLFGNDTFEFWIEVRADDIVARIDIPANEMDPRSVLYVKRDARVVTCQVHKACEVDKEGVDPGGAGLPPPPWRT